MVPSFTPLRPMHPRPTFTFLFTDIEGSSRLWEQNAEAMALALARHDTLLNDVFSSHGGHVFKMMGDSVCVAFSEPSRALDAAIAGQRALQAEEWEIGRPLRVRAALHRGVAEARNDDYFGPTLNRTARLLAAGHGGQTLLSRAARDGLDLPDGISLRDLGERRLRDLASPEHIYQIVAPGLPAEFPPLRTLEAHPNNLPAQITSFIGRERDLEGVKNALAASRLVTLTGPGGTGKTRLASEAGAALIEQFIDGVWMVELALVTEASSVSSSVAAALGLREENERTVEALLLDYLRQRRLLLILDNCEHLVASAASIAERILRGAPGVRILATSREALAIAGERTYPLQSLSMPDFVSTRWTPSSVLARSAEFEAVRLFVERAAAVQPGFALTEENALTIAKICWRLDGIPLALELAAARVKMLSPEQIYRRLDDRFRLLTAGARTVLPRQQTLSALIDWSYDLLSEKEQALLRRCAVFGGGRTLRAVESVCSGDGIEEWEILDLLQQLIDKSLLSTELADMGTARYVMIESVWEYSRAKLLESGEAHAVRNRHLDYFVKLAEEAEPQLQGPQQGEWIERLAREHGNLKLALEWSTETPSAVERGMRLAGALWRYWEVRSHLKEGREYLSELLSKPESEPRTIARAKALTGAGRLAWCLDDNAAARKLGYQAILLHRETGNARMAALICSWVGFAAFSEGDPDFARKRFDESIAYGRAHQDSLALATGLAGLGTLAGAAGDYATARAYKHESLAAYQAVGDVWVVGLIAWSLSRVAIAQHDLDAARQYLRDALTAAEQLGNEWLIPYLLEGFGDIALGENDPRRCANLYGAAEVMRQQHGLGLPPTEKLARDQVLNRLRAALPPAEFETAWTEGRALGQDAALRLAIGGMA
jgi:predicted ATPase/class 3 adenylate cyclase